jgi:hypothetical protein
MNHVRLNVIQNTSQKGSRPLCNTCTFGLVMRGGDDEFAFCTYIRQFVTVCVSECNRYSRSGEDLLDSEQMLSQ